MSVKPGDCQRTRQLIIRSIFPSAPINKGPKEPHGPGLVGGGRLTGGRRSTVPPRNTDVCRGDQCRWTQQGQGPFGGWETPCLPAQAAGAATTASQAAAPPLFLSPDSKPTLGNQQQKTIP